MNCIIENGIKHMVAKSKRLKVLVRYFRIHYNISISETELELRMQKLKLRMPERKRVLEFQD